MKNLVSTDWLKKNKFLIYLIMIIGAVISLYLFSDFKRNTQIAIIFSGFNFFDVLITISIIGFPLISCNTFGSLEFILVPFPAARITTAKAFFLCKSIVSVYLCPIL